MGFRRFGDSAHAGLRTGAFSLTLTLCGALAVLAWREGLWGSLIGTLLVAVWIAVILARSQDREQHRAGATMRAASAVEAAEGRLHGVVLDAVPTPMLAVRGDSASAINRAARQVFGTDDRVLPVPAALLDGDERIMRHEGRRWRMDRIFLRGSTAPQVVALVDIEREERTGEARAAAELLQVLGHELMNGLAPIASLAESGMAVAATDPPDAGLVRDILGTIARHSEGLQRFVETYRALARLPEPRLEPVVIADLLADIERLFAGRWPEVGLTMKIADGPPWPIDRDQLRQALWALLQNAAEAALSAACNLSPPSIELTVDYADRTLAISVQDSGAGVDPDSREQMFRPFFTTKPDGTGIGLSLARQIAHAHGGTLTLENCRPATFRIRLPLGV